MERDGGGTGRGGGSDRRGKDQYQGQRKVTENGMVPVEIVGACAIAASSSSI